jgi:hypothetical protein
MPSTFEPTVINSLNGRQPVALAQFEGAHRIPNRDAVGFYFTIQAPSFAEASRIAVLFSGTSFYAKPEHFGLPDYGDRDTNFVQFALAAVGDYLDEVGLPAFAPSGVSATQIDAFSSRFQKWKERPPASDDAVLSYIKARMYWTWKYDIPRTLFSSHDLLRLGLEVSALHRLAQLEEGNLWRTHSKSAFGISLEPTPALLRDQRSLLESANPVRPPSPMTPLTDQPENENVPKPAPSDSGRKKARPSAKTRRRKSKGSDATALVFVDEARLTDLRQLSPANFDLRKLIGICNELNVCYRSQCYFAVAALTRTLLDHVPPVFALDTFAQVANHYSGGGRSFSGSMKHLETSARHIADGHLHGRIRKKESLPTRTQVNFSSDIDVLLGEVVRVLS